MGVVGSALRSDRESLTIVNDCTNIGWSDSVVSWVMSIVRLKWVRRTITPIRTKRKDRVRPCIRLRGIAFRDSLTMATTRRGIMEKVNVTCRLDAQDVAFLDKLAEVTERDRSYLIKKAVADYIALHRWQIEEIEQAIKEADEGQFASDKEVRAAFKEFQ